MNEEMAAREKAQAKLAHAQRMEALGQLAGGIAHDFNNVLQAVSGGLALIERRAQDPEVRRLASMAADAASRGAAITGRLLSFARRGELRASQVQPLPLLQNLGEMLTPASGSGTSSCSSMKLSISRTGSGGMPLCESDRSCSAWITLV